MNEDDGTSITATVEDICEECSGDNIALPLSAFSALAGIEDPPGQISVVWYFDD